ncbi:hypothetical protein GCM10011585_23130 [Edaphobacter dinghuensis]|uniref:Uncharacterized protein n=1 Tax=Edaphobacter dinghuensis TaxID=1560005 RepID=A0A917HGT5_9BACT|nr:hypothetical protein GCM10011585_23130 [Edaphobacter dinghuensis]
MAKDARVRFSCSKGIGFSPLPNLPQKRFSFVFAGWNVYAPTLRDAAAKDGAPDRLR